MINNIESHRKSIQVPIPKKIDLEGGNFEIDLSASFFSPCAGQILNFPLVSVEDKYRCKRPVTVSGITVNVRRIKVTSTSIPLQTLTNAFLQPTVKFYGENGKRHVTVLENEKTNLPLRLTGDGVRVYPLILDTQLLNPNSISLGKYGITELRRRSKSSRQSWIASMRFSVLRTRECTRSSM